MKKSNIITQRMSPEAVSLLNAGSGLGQNLGVLLDAVGQGVAPEAVIPEIPVQVQAEQRSLKLPPLPKRQSSQPHKTDPSGQQWQRNGAHGQRRSGGDRFGDNFSHAVKAKGEPVMLFQFRGDLIGVSTLTGVQTGAGLYAEHAFVAGGTGTVYGKLAVQPLPGEGKEWVQAYSAPEATLAATYGANAAPKGYIIASAGPNLAFIPRGASRQSAWQQRVQFPMPEGTEPTLNNSAMSVVPGMLIISSNVAKLAGQWEQHHNGLTLHVGPEKHVEVRAWSKSLLELIAPVIVHDMRRLQASLDNAYAQYAHLEKIEDGRPMKMSRYLSETIARSLFVDPAARIGCAVSFDDAWNMTLDTCVPTDERAIPVELSQIRSAKVREIIALEADRLRAEADAVREREREEERVRAALAADKAKKDRIALEQKKEEALIRGAALEKEVESLTASNLAFSTVMLHLGKKLDTAGQVVLWDVLMGQDIDPGQFGGPSMAPTPAAPATATTTLAAAAAEGAPVKVKAKAPKKETLKAKAKAKAPKAKKE